MSKTSLKNPHLILLVEDHLLTQHVTRLFLETLGSGIVCADSGESAISVANRSVFHAIMVDIGLPDYDGFQLIEHLQKLQPKHTRFIAITSYITPELEARAKKNHCTAILQKPITAETQIEGRSIHDFLCTE